jgi:hypothetical protein
MNIAQIEEAVRRGVPFKLKVADGDEYRVLIQITSFFRLDPLRNGRT